LSKKDLRALRGPSIGMIFQEPMTSLNPVFRIGDQIIETIRAHEPAISKAARANARSAARPRSASPCRSAAWTTFRTSSPAACASA
jgi:ABC-type microcin C transport system duplicated ATPase subunit YejF